MSCYPQADGETDVVFTGGWRCNATDGTDDATQYGTVNVTYVAGVPYTPYANLTQAQVQGWVWANGVDQAAVAFIAVGTQPLFELVDHDQHCVV